MLLSTIIVVINGKKLQDIIELNKIQDNKNIEEFNENDSYKDNIELFYYEFDEYKSFIDEWAIKYPNNKLYIEDLFKDWLFNKLFKLEE